MRIRNGILSHYSSLSDSTTCSRGFSGHYGNFILEIGHNFGLLRRLEDLKMEYRG